MRRSRFNKLTGAVQGGTHHAFRCADNVAQAIDRRMPEAKALASWLDQDRGRLGLPDGEDFEDFGLRKAVPAVSWRRIRTAISRGLRTAPGAAGTGAELWLDALCGRLGLNALDRKLLALALYYELDERVEHLVDGISTARGGAARLRCDFILLALLLADEPGAVEARLHPDSRLLASGLMRLDSDGDLDIIGRLAKLVRNSALPAADPFAQLLGRTLAATLPWDAFAHLGREEPCCMNRGCGRSYPSPACGQAMRTEIGRPSSSMRLSAWTATPTSVARCRSVRERSPSPITCLNLPMAASAQARLV